MVCEECRPRPGGYPPTLKFETFYDDEVHQAIMCDNIVIPPYTPSANVSESYDADRDAIPAYAPQANVSTLYDTDRGVGSAYTPQGNDTELHEADNDGDEIDHCLQNLPANLHRRSSAAASYWAWLCHIAEKNVTTGSSFATNDTRAENGSVVGAAQYGRSAENSSIVGAAQDGKSWLAVALAALLLVSL